VAWPCPRGAVDGLEQEKGSSSFFKKRTKKLF
jgi:hypothetical protein